MLVATTMTSRLAGLSTFSRLGDEVAALSLAFERLQATETRYRLSGDRTTQDEMKAQLEATTALLAKQVEDIPTEDKPVLDGLTQILAAHGGRVDRLIRTTRSAEAARVRLIAVGEQLSSASNELVGAPDADATDERYAAFLIDRKIQLMRMTSQQFMAAHDTERLRSFLLVAKSLETVISTAAPMLGEHASLLPPISNQVSEFKTLFGVWAEAAMDADRLYNQDMRPESAAAVRALHTLTTKFAANFGSLRGAASDETESGMRLLALVSLASVLVGLGLAVLTVRSVIPPLRRCTLAMRRLAEGDHVTEIAELGRRDEIGEMAGMLKVFQANAIEGSRLSAAEGVAQEVRLERARRLETLIADFEAEVSGTLRRLTDASGMMESTSRDLAATAEQTNSQSMNAASAAGQTSANVQNVASAAEQLSASIHEIARQVAHSEPVAQLAVSNAAKTNLTVLRLAKGASEIGAFVKMIDAIAAQTNLHALNATIEAARAGDAGKGFAVVANEVKALAAQTASATGQIGRQITTIQAATQDAVRDITEISRVIAEINQIGTGVAEAVQQQGAATAEIARSVEQAACGTDNVSQNIGEVRQAADRTGSAAEALHAVAEDIATKTIALSAEISSFTASVKAA